MALIIAGERSGVGKTTVTLMLLAYLCKQHKVQSFKVGPDYIDPMFHQYVTRRPCRNLDPVLTSEAYVKRCFTQHIQQVNYALIEGVMGLFDGASGTDDKASTAHIARLLDLPVLLVIDCSRLSRSVAAIAHGYRTFDPRVKVAGVILNRVGSDRHLQLLKQALEPLQLPIMGILRRQDNITIPDRHLGLVPTEEIPQINELIDRLTQLGETCFDWEKLLPLLEVRIQKPEWGNENRYANRTQNLEVIIQNGATRGATLTEIKSPLRLAVARDRAFNFYYQDNLEIFASLGAELIYWSPLNDSDLPENVHGLYFGGGFPEVFAAQLTENSLARQAVKKAIFSGIPTYAECGGLMYLAEQIIDFDGKSWSMVGIIPTTAVMDARLTLGYRQATALQNTSLLTTGTIIWGHEFHRSHLSQMPQNPLFQLQGFNQNATLEGWQMYNLHASYLHLHFGSNLEVPRRFLQQCLRSARSHSACGFKGKIQHSS